MAYVATIDILIDVETEAEAMDAIAESIRPLMQAFNPQSCFKDWNWSDKRDDDESLLKIGSIPSSFQMDNEWPWAQDTVEA